MSSADTPTAATLALVCGRAKAIHRGQFVGSAVTENDRLQELDLCMMISSSQHADHWRTL